MEDDSFMDEEGYMRLVQLLWTSFASQIVSPVSYIMLPIEILEALGPQGERYFVRECSDALGFPAGFVVDGNDNTRAYLGNWENMETMMDADLWVHQDYRFPVLMRRRNSNRSQ